MSWLSDFADSLQSGIDPNKNGSNIPLFGALGGLAMAATPHAGKGLGWGNALAGTIGDVSGGYAMGQMGQQKYQAGQLANTQAAAMNPLELQNKQIANRMAQLGLERQETLQPLQLQAMTGALGGQQPANGNAPQMPGSLAPQGSPNAQPYDGLRDQMIQAGRLKFGLTGDPTELEKAYQAAYENDPMLAAAKTYGQERNKVVSSPNGPISGAGVLGGVNFGSLAPQVTSNLIKASIADRQPGGIGPGNQTPAELPTPEGQGQIPPINASALQPPQQGGQSPMPPPPQGMPPQGAQPQAPQQQQMPQQPPRQAAFMPPQQAPQGQQSNQLQALIAQQQAPQAQALQNVAKGVDGKPLLASDGQPILPSLANAPFYKPDPTMTPKFNTVPSSNTNTGVEAAKQQLAQQTKDLSEGNQSFTEAASSLATEKYNIQQISSILAQTKSGTAMAQWPDLAKHAAALGIIQDPSTIHSLAELQSAVAISAKETLSNIKDNAATIGGPSMRIFGSEVAAQMKNGINIENQPEALYKMVTTTGGLIDQHLDLINSWQKAGGSGNRLAGGNTMLPSDFAQQFLPAHPAQTYKQSFEANTPAFKGMPQANPQDIVNELRKRGHQIQ